MHTARSGERRKLRSAYPAVLRLGWKTDGLSYRYPGSSVPAVADVSIEVPAAACTAVLGPNGSGKSTLLRLLLGAVRPDRGTIDFGGRPLPAWSRRDLARSIGVVTQNEQISFPITVRQLVAMGRYPHLGLLRPERPPDRRAIDDALARCDMAERQDRLIDTLSGGEWQRARIARALAQEPRVLALDEPSLALDIRHEMDIFELVRRLLATGVTVLVVTHNLNLAARYADRLILLDGGRVVRIGTAAEVLSQEVVERVYRWPVTSYPHPGPGPDTGAIQITPLMSQQPPIPARHSALEDT